MPTLVETQLHTAQILEKAYKEEGINLYSLLVYAKSQNDMNKVIYLQELYDKNMMRLINESNTVMCLLAQKREPNITSHLF